MSISLLSFKAVSFPSGFKFGFWVVMAIYIWILPVGGTTAARNLAMVMLLLITVTAIVRDKVTPCFPGREIWLAYLAVAAATLGYAIDPVYSLQEIRVEVMYPALIFFIAATMIKTPTDWMRLAFVLLVGDFVLAAFNIFTGLTGGSTKDGLIGSLNSGVGTYSTYVITVLPVLIALGVGQRNRLGRWLFFVVIAIVIANLVALCFTQNRQSFVALFAEYLMVCFFLLKRSFTVKRLTVATLLCLMLMLMFVFQFAQRNTVSPEANLETIVQVGTKHDPRWPVWKRVIADVAASPMVGSGFGLRTFNLRYEGKVNFEGPFWHAHNMVLNKAVQMGVPGLVIFLGLFFFMPWRLRHSLNTAPVERLIARAGIALAGGVFVKNMTDDFFVRDGALLYWLLAGATLGSLRSCIKAKAEKE